MVDRSLQQSLTNICSREEPEEDNSSLSLFLSDDEKTLCKDECTSSYAEIIPFGNISEDSEMASKCSLPPFRRADPDLWFIQAEAFFHVYGVRSDFLRYNMVICKLDARTMQEVKDVLRSSPALNKYEVLKAAIISRLCDSVDNNLQLESLDENSHSSDLQLHEQFTHFELEGKKPSEIIDKISLLSDHSMSEHVIDAAFDNILQIKATQPSSSIMPSTSHIASEPPQDYLNGLIQKFSVLSTDKLQGGIVTASKLNFSDDYTK